MSWERRHVSEDPRIRFIPGFLSPGQCDALIAASDGKLAPATRARPEGLSHRWTSDSAIIDLPAAIRDDIARATGLPQAAQDDAMVQRYGEGGEFEPHYDFMHPDWPRYDLADAAKGQRLVTFLVWLNDDFEGGETAFTTLGMRFKGRKGDALYWANVDPEGRPDEKTLHAGLPVAAGEKWLLTQLIRSKAQTGRRAAAAAPAAQIPEPADAGDVAKPQAPAFSNTWFDKHIAQWEVMLRKQGLWGADRALNVVEVGSFEGRSTLWLLDNVLTHPDSRIYCVDTFEGGVEHRAEEAAGLWERFQANIAASPHAAKVIVRRGSSRNVLVELLHEGVSADVLHVDGSHEAPDVLEDLILGFRLLKRMGLMICDDYLWSASERPWEDDILRSPKLAIDAFTNIFWRKFSVLRGQPLYQLAGVKLFD